MSATPGKTPEQRRIFELEETVLTLTAWLTQVPGCFGRQDYQAMADRVIEARREHSFRDAADTTEGTG